MPGRTGETEQNKKWNLAARAYRDKSTGKKWSVCSNSAQKLWRARNKMKRLAKRSPWC